MRLRTHTQRSFRPGFTLMEMMVVVAIIVVLGGIGIVVFSNLSDRGNETKAASAVKDIDKAAYFFYLEHNVYPAKVEDLMNPDVYGKTYLKREALDPPWPGSQYMYTFPGQNMKAVNNEDKPDVWIKHPNGAYGWCNWKTGKIPMN